MRKESRKFNLWQRFSALALAVLMVTGMLPYNSVAQAASDTDGIVTVADPETLTRPETIYGDNTVNAGKITVGKSVSDTDITVNGQNIAIDGDNNFLITISQSAQVMGLTSEINVPLDVVIVFDTSGSMGNDSNGNGKNRTQELVEAANEMIASLMEMNDLNRVGVVAFSAHNAGGGTAGYNAANVLSELAHYDGEAATEHLTWTTGTGPSWAPTVQLVQGRSTTNGRTNSRYGTGGATNIQAGVTLGAQLLMEADTTVEINNQEITRTPIMILMSDGAPTVSAYENQWWNASQTNNQGPTNAPFMGNGFLTVLTASHYKNEITQHYYGENAGNNACSFYTVGVELSDVATQDTREEVDLSYMTLNPTGEFVAGSDNYYYDRSNAADSFLDAWTSYRNNQDFAVRVWADQTRHDGYYYFYNSSRTIQNANDHKNGPDTWTTVGRTTVQANILDSVTTLHYNDKFYDVTDVSNLTDALNDMLTEIARKAITVPTKVTTGDHDFDGYVTFTDPIGEYMEVKDMKGILADGYFYQGASFAKNLANYGTADADTEFDALILDVVKSRMNLTSSVVDINDFLTKMKASPNQAYYNGPDDYDNSLVWWGNAYDSGDEDEQVQVMAFADNDTIEYIEAQRTAGTIPEGADYVCRSYFFYGTAGGVNPNPDHEYLYFMVRVQRELTAPYRETVVISAPASLLSMERVLITETFDEDGNPVYTSTVEHQEPARVVYEVGLWDSITAENVSGIVSAEYAAETVNGNGSLNYDAATDTYNFFTNDWDRSQSLDSHHRALAKATFDAAADNAFYTYQEDTLIMDENGDPVTSDPAGTTAYYVREYYEWPADAKQDGTYSATKKTILIEVDIPADAELIGKNGKWYIPAGAYTAATLVVNGDDTEKTTNATGTSAIVAHPHRTGDSSNSHYTVFLGNNGMLSLKADPYKPHKTVSVNLPSTAVNIVDDEGKAVKVGDVLTYTVEVKNTMATAADITVTDYVPLGTAFVEGSAGSGTDDTGHTLDASIMPDSNNVLTWVLKDVPAGEIRYVSFRVTVTKAALSLSVVPDTIDNTAAVQLENGPTVSTNTTHNPPYGKSVTDVNNQDIDGDHGFKVGDTLVYHIRFHNNAMDDSGNFVAADVTVTDKVPDGTTFLSADNGGSYNAATGIVTWTFDNMAADTAKVVSFQVKINASAKIEETGTQPEEGEIYLPNTAIIVVDNDPEITLTTNTTENWADVGDMVLTKLVAEGGDRTKTFTINLTEATGLLDGIYVLKRGTVDETVVFNAGKASVTIKHGEELTIKGLPAGVIITVEEDISALPGWTPTYNTQSVTIVKGSATTVSSVSVTNTYTLEPLTVTVKGEKNMNGVLPSQTTFGFVAEPDSSNPIAGDPLTGEVTVKTSGEYAFTLSSKTFTQPGVYKYTISEISGGVEGVTYDTTDYALVINVTDNGDGTMSAAATLDGSPFDLDEDAVSFTNTYVPDDVPLTLVAQKTLKVYDAATGTYVDATPDAGKFRFQIVEKGTTNVVTTGSNAADGTITFNTFYFSASMLDGAESKTFTYVISEVVPELAKDPNMLYDLNGREIEVTLSYAADGTLSVTVDGDSDGTVDLTDSVNFVNYSNPDSVEIRPEGTKTTANAPAGVSFSFSVINTATGNEAAAGVGDANGSITFSAMSFDQTGTYTYWIKESNAGNTTNGITYDATRYLMKVVVSRNSYNRLVAEVTYWSSAVDGSENAADYTVAATAPSFHNEYNAGGYINLTATKKLTGRDLNAGEFAFKLVRQDNGGEIDGIVDGSGKITFSTMYYSEDDIPNGETSVVIHYVMSEVIPTTAKLPGVTYDTKSYDVYVRITDNGNGTITPVLVEPDGKGGYTAISGTDTGVTFSNSYTTVNGDEIKFRIRKTLNGRDLREGEFDFLLYRDGSVVDIATNDANGIVTFTRQIPATAAPGTYEMIIREASGSLAGVTYDTASYKIYVKITDDGKGNIVAQLVDASGNSLPVDDSGVVDLTDEIEFVNTYVPGDVPVQLEATKELTGRKMNDKEFSFVVRQNNVNGNIVATGSNDASGKILFSTFDITAADMAGATSKTFTYVVVESDNNIPGVTVDDTVFTVTVTVIDDGTGALQAVINYPDDEPIVFKNTYKPAPTELPLVAYKTLTGKNLAASEFTFELKDAAGEVIQTATNDGSGVVSFENLKFDKADTYVYTLTEKAGDMTGMVYDTNVYTITVTVTDDLNGNLVAAASYTDTEGKVELIRFANSYTPPAIDVELDGTKSIVDTNGASLSYDLSGFEFEVRDTEGKLLSTAVSDDEGNIKFTGFEFSAAGEYRFLISEKTTTRPGYTTDPTVWCVHITIGYNADTGELYKAGEFVHLAPESHDEVMAQASETLSFVNVYDPVDVGLTLKVRKELDGRDLRDHEFTFYMVDQATGLRAAEGRNNASGEVSLHLTYTKAGTYNYVISESVPTDGEKLGGVTYTDETYEVTVTVTDDGTGVLKAQLGEVIAVGTGTVDLTASVVFHNTYTPAPVDVTIEALKRLEGKGLTAGIFTFELVNVEDPTDKRTATNAVDGKITFETITYTEAGVYEYTLSEQIGTAGGVTYDTTVYTVTVTVTDNGNGNLQAATHYARSDEGTEAVPVFNNSYTAEKVGVQIMADKDLVNKNMVGGEFTFELKDGDGNTIQATNDAGGSIVFEEIEYVEAGVYEYTLYEVEGDNGGITYDETVYTVTVTVTDNGEGALTADVVYAKGTETVETEDVVFTNTYTVEPVDVVIEAEKNLEGKSLKNGDFEFVLTDKDGNEIKATNAADGSVTFEKLTFTEADVYVYTLTETKGDMVSVTYDTTTYTVTVTVTDNGEGTLTADVVYTKDSDKVEKPIFNNIYKGASVTADVQAEKLLTGKTLTAGQFTFELVNDNDPADKHTAVNAADGSIVFEDLIFNETGVYTYKLYEEKGTDKNVTYDETVYTVTVTVTDDLNGKLVAEVDYNGETPVFENVYTPEPITVTLEGTKKLTGRDLKAGEFSFQVSDADGNLITTGTNTADGKIRFDAAVIDTEMDLTIYVAEVKGNDRHIRYDDSTYRVRLTVTNENGTLVSSVTYMDGEIVFCNEYEKSVMPSTGDDTPMFAYIGLMTLSALALSAMLLLRRKKERNAF